MKRNQVNSILVNQTKRRATVFAYICVIVIVFSLVCASFLEYIDRNESQYVSYDETSNIDYQVYYKENDFFYYMYLEADKQYIASLIDKINVEFSKVDVTTGKELPGAHLEIRDNEEKLDETWVSTNETHFF